MVSIKPIKTKKDYRQALQHINELWDVKLNIPEGDKFEILVTLVEKYEEKHFKIEAPDPIEAIKFVLEQKGVHSSALEKILGRIILKNIC